MSDSETKRLVLLGGGEHASVVADAAGEERWQLLGYVAPDHAHAPSLSHLSNLGDDSAFTAHLASTSADARPALVIAFGGADTTPARRDLAARYPDATFATIVHPTAWISKSARVEAGAVVLAGAIVNTGASIGRHAIVNSGAIVEHDVQLGDFVQLSPRAVVGGGARLADGVFVGMGAVIRDHVAVGADARIGMGAVVVADVEAGTTVIGSPARPAPKS